MTNVPGVPRLKLATLTAVILLVPVAVMVIGTGAASAHYCAKSGELRFRAADGAKLAGHRFGRGTTAVIFAHEIRGGACQWIPYARRLAARGFLTIAFDFRGYGDSQRRTGSSGSRLPADITAAVKLARSLGARKVVLVGASMGGTAVVVAAANVRPAVDGVVSLSGVGTLGYMNATAAARTLTMPVLYVVGKQDIGFVDESRALYDATASPMKKLEIPDNTYHGVQLVQDPPTRTLVEEFVADIAG
jgi:pimeloyl-ACP methyl ester carboxylesterase